MKDIHFSKTKFNIAWSSTIVIFIGAIVYIPFLHFADQKREVVYYKVPVSNYQRGLPNISITNVPAEGNRPATEVTSLQTEKPVIIKVAEPLITKDLRMGDVDPEVKKLQKYLNSKGFLVAESGPGSPGNETERFGAGTKDALIRFQEAHSEILLRPVGLTNGTGIVGELTRKFISS